MELRLVPRSDQGEAELHKNEIYTITTKNVQPHIAQPYLAQ